MAILIIIILLVLILGQLAYTSEPRIYTPYELDESKDSIANFHP